MTREDRDLRAIAATVEAIGPPDAGARAEARRRQARLTKPEGSLGRLEELAVTLAGISGEACPSIAGRVIFVCAADHGVAAQGVSAYPSSVTAQMVYNFVRGGAAINVLAARARARIVVADVGVDHDFPPGLPIAHAKIGRGTADMTLGPAMSRAAAARAVATGIALGRVATPPPPARSLPRGHGGDGDRQHHRRQRHRGRPHRGPRAGRHRAGHGDRRLHLGA